MFAVQRWSSFLWLAQGNELTNWFPTTQIIVWALFGCVMNDDRIWLTYDPQIRNRQQTTTVKIYPTRTSPMWDERQTEQCVIEV